YVRAGDSAERPDFTLTHDRTQVCQILAVENAADHATTKFDITVERQVQDFFSAKSNCLCCQIHGIAAADLYIETSRFRLVDYRNRSTGVNNENRMLAIQFRHNDGNFSCSTKLHPG